MKKIIIEHIPNNENEAEVLRQIANDIEAGYTNGLVGCTTIEWSIEKQRSKMK